MKKNNHRIKLISIFLLIYFFAGAEPVLAARVFIEPAQGEYRPGDTFLAEIRIDNEGECINAAEINISFTNSNIQITNFSQADSILSLWISPPEIDQSQGRLSLIGGIPGGYCGRIAGDPGPSDLLGKIIVSIPGTAVSQKKESLAEIKFLDSSQVLLSDRQGTNARLSLQGASYRILSQPGSGQDQWSELIGRDHTPPEGFDIEIAKDPSVFEGKYFIVFLTNDKESGIDYYDVKEGDGEWRRAISPYLLENQDLNVSITVRAVDKAGNKTIAQKNPIKIRSSIASIIAAAALFMLFIIALTWFIFIIKKSKKHK